MYIEDGQVSLFDQDIWSGRMSPAPSAAETQKDRTSRRSSKNSLKSQSRMPRCVCCRRVTDGQNPAVTMIAMEDGRLLGEYTMHSFGESPQRRKRIALVADFGGLSAPEVLFERKGLSRDSEPSGTERETTSRSVGTGSESAISFQERAGCPDGGKGILIQNERTGALSTLNNQAVCYGLDHVMLSGGTTYQGRGYYEDVSGCLKTQAHGVMCLND